MEESLTIENEELLSDGDISEVIRRSNKSGNHSEILNFIKEKNLSLVSCFKNSENDLMNHLLVDVVNGHKIVKSILDNCAVATCEEEDSVDFAIVMDWRGMFENQESNQTLILFHLLNLSTKNPGTFSELLKHPVIETFITLKWKESKKYFYVQSVFYLTFLMLYSIFIVYLFNKPENRCSRFDTKLPQPASINCSPEDYTGTGTTFLDTSEDTEFLLCETLFLILTLILTSLEVYQALRLQRQYFKEIENLFEWFVLLSAFTSMGFKEVILQESSDNPVSSYVRGFTSLGICLAWLELIFMIGRYPFRGGVFSIMFYNVVKKLSSYMVAMLCMIIGHAFAFMVINYGQDMDSFKSPFKSIVQTLTMTLGEFNFEDLYDAYKGDDRTSRNFAMILLVLLILFGTITMVNLFIAAIMSDLETLKRDVVTQSLVFTAQCSILVEKVLPKCFLDKMRLEERKVYCVHDICTKDCTNEKLPEEISHITKELKKIAKERKRNFR